MGETAYRWRCLPTTGQRLAAGTIRLPASPSRVPSAGAPVPATHRTGALVVDVFIYGARLVPNAAGPVIVRVHDAANCHGVDGVALVATPEFGLSMEQPFRPTSGGGWSEARVRADGLVATWTSATATPPSAAAGSWYGDFP